jgi:hypothetical protein
LWDKGEKIRHNLASKKSCLLFRVASTKRYKYGITLLASLLKASKRGALSAGMADLSSEPGLLNTVGATFFNELHAIYVVRAIRLSNVV